MRKVINIDGSRYETPIIKNMRWYQDNYGDLWNVAWMHDQPYNKPDARVDAILHRKRQEMTQQQLVLGL